MKSLRSLIMIGTALLLVACSTTNTSVTNTPETFPTFNDNLQSSLNAIFVGSAPIPHSKTFSYQAQNIQNQSSLSRYQVTLNQTKNKLTLFDSTEDRVQSSVTVHGVGYGGIMPILYTKTVPLSNKEGATTYYQLQSISNIQGSLFPFRVGNQVSFNYQEQIQRSGTKEPSTHINNGRMMLKITGHMNNFTSGNLQITGDIWIIQVSKAVGNNPFTIQQVVYFSQVLGWAVEMINYQNGVPVDVYNIVDWKTSLVFMKPPEQ